VGVILEASLDTLSEFPALLVLVPPFLASAGALGGILVSRLTSNLHLGVVDPTAWPGRLARTDIGRGFALAGPTFVAVGVGAQLVAGLGDLASPGLVRMVAVALAGGVLVTGAGSLVAYYSAIASFRSGLDPDNVGVPLVTATIDLVGGAAFIIAVAAFGVT